MYDSKFIKLVSPEMFCLVEENFYDGGRGGDTGKTNELREETEFRGTGWLSRVSVRLLISVQVLISRFVSASRCPSTTWDSLSSLSAPSPLVYSLSK